MAVTKRDLKYGLASMSGDIATEDEVKSKVCDSIQMATMSSAHKLKISFPPVQVIAVSGLWALQSKELLSSKCENQMETVAMELRKWPGLNGGQGENRLSSLLKLSPEELATKLRTASGITDLEQRYNIKSPVVAPPL